MAHRRFFYILPLDLEDLFLADLHEAGTLGVQSMTRADGRVRFEAWFAADLAGQPLDAETLAAWRGRGVEPDGEEWVPDTDWLAVYREHARPFAVARHFFVDPREPGEPSIPAADIPAGRQLLHLPARGAFGTGSHESTSLALDLLADVDLGGKRVLDVGTGTGILCFAALLAGARSAVGFDIDLTSPFHGLENRRLNRVGRLAHSAPAFFAGTSAALAARAEKGFDLALINVVPEEILPEIAHIARLIGPSGEAILSGILVERGKQVLERMAGLGFTERGRRTAGDWVAFRVGRGGVTSA